MVTVKSTSICFGAHLLLSVRKIPVKKNIFFRLARIFLSTNDGKPWNDVNIYSNSNPVLSLKMVCNFICIYMHPVHQIILDCWITITWTISHKLLCSTIYLFFLLISLMITFQKKKKKEFKEIILAEMQQAKFESTNYWMNLNWY